MTTEATQPTRARRPAGRRWAAVALAAGAALLVAALFSPDRGQRLEQHEASGPLRELPADQVQQVTLRSATGQWQLRRQGGGWVSEPALPASTAVLNERIELGLRLLRNTAIERELEQAAPDFGLDSPALRVSIFTGAEPAAPPRLEAAFGQVNPIGLAHYVRLTMAGQAQTVLLPTYVAESWQQVLAR